MSTVLAASNAARELVRACTVSNLWSHGTSRVLPVKNVWAALTTTREAAAEGVIVGVLLMGALGVATEAVVEAAGVAMGLDMDKG